MEELQASVVHKAAVVVQRLTAAVDVDAKAVQQVSSSGNVL
jgi:hypothetical protein